MSRVKLSLFVCSMGVLNALEQKTVEAFKHRLVEEGKRLVAPADEAIGLVAFDPTRVSFTQMDQLLTEIKESVAALDIDLRTHLQDLDAITKLVKEFYQKAWSDDQLARHKKLAPMRKELVAKKKELQLLEQGAQRDLPEGGVRAVDLLITVFDQLDQLRQQLQSYYRAYEQKRAVRKKVLSEKAEEIPLVQPVQPKPAVVPAPEKPQPKPVQPAPQKPVPQKPNIFQQGAQWLGRQIFDDPEAQRWYEYGLSEIPMVAEAVFVTSKLPVSNLHFSVWDDRVHSTRLFVLSKAPDSSIKGYLGFMGATDDTLKKMYKRKRESFTAEDAASLMMFIESIAEKRKGLAAFIKSVRDDAWNSRYNRYGAELIDLVLAMHQYGAEVLRQEILERLKKQQQPKTTSPSWKTKIQQFFGL